MFENGEKLRGFLKDNGIEITKIAAQLNVTRQTIDIWLKTDKNLEMIFEAAARPFVEYINKNKSLKTNEKLIEYQAKKIMDLEEENEKLKHSLAKNIVNPPSKKNH